MLLLGIPLQTLAVTPTSTPADSLPDAPQAQSTSGQASSSRPSAGAGSSTADPVALRTTPRHILQDQEAIWTSPAHLRGSNALGPILLVLATTGAITADHQVMSSSRLQDTSLNNHAVTASNGLVGGFIAAPVLFYGLGHFRHDNHAAETGILGGEAILDSLAVNEVLKIVSLRERPTVDGAKGKFFQTGVGFNSSFPSNHSIIAWSSAAVIASEYDSRMAQLGVYALATGVSVTRVLGREHFPSDVLVGSAVGWMIGHYVCKRHGHYRHERDYYY